MNFDPNQGNSSIRGSDRREAIRRPSKAIDPQGFMGREEAEEE